MVKYSTAGFSFSVRVLYLDEMCKTVKINATQVVNIMVRPRPLRHQPPPAFGRWQFLGCTRQRQMFRSQSVTVSLKSE